MINTVGLQVELNERNYVFSCPAGAPIGEIHDALQQMKYHVIEIMQKADSQQTKQAEPAYCEEGCDG